MAVKNNLVQQSQKQTFSAYLTQDAIKNKINQMVGGKDGQRFITSMISAASVNPALSECDFSTIVSAAMLGESLKLSPSPQLGQYYMVPFNDRKRNCKIAQFVLGAKGYKQLAIRSGQYLDIDVIEVKQGELKGRDKYSGKQVFEFIEDENIREEIPTIGYLAYLELLNGFKKNIYWTKEKMEKHADKYSAAFSLVQYEKLKKGEIPKSEMWKYSSYWYSSFSEMAEKTMLKQLISKWGIMSIELQTAFERDDTLLHEDGSFEYVDNVSEDEPSADDPPTIDTAATVKEEKQPTPPQTDDPFDQLFGEQAGA